MKILIADDSSELSNRLTYTINAIEGAEVVGVAQAAEEAVSFTKQLVPDIVILDIKMPGGGMSALERIKSEDPSPIVIMFTNHAVPPIKKKCMKLGAEYFVSKMSESGKIAEIIKEFVSKNGES